MFTWTTVNARCFEVQYKHWVIIWQLLADAGSPATLEEKWSSCSNIQWVLRSVFQCYRGLCVSEFHGNHDQAKLSAVTRIQRPPWFVPFGLWIAGLGYCMATITANRKGRTLELLSQEKLSEKCKGIELSETDCTAEHFAQTLDRLVRSAFTEKRCDQVFQSSRFRVALAGESSNANVFYEILMLLVLRLTWLDGVLEPSINHVPHYFVCQGSSFLYTPLKVSVSQKCLMPCLEVLYVATFVWTLWYLQMAMIIMFVVDMVCTQFLMCGSSRGVTPAAHVWKMIKKKKTLLWSCHFGIHVELLLISEMLIQTMHLHILVYLDRILGCPEY